MENITYKSMEELYIDNRKLVFAYISDYSTEKTFMEDIASIVWVKVWEHEETFLGMDKRGVKAYLRAMVKTTLSDYFRTQERENRVISQMGEDLQVFEPFDDGESEAFFEDMLCYLQEAIQELSEEDKLLIVLRFINKKSAKEVGELLEITEGNVRVRQLRILAKMKQRIKMMMKAERRTDGFER